MRTNGQVPNGSGHYRRVAGQKIVKRNYPSRFVARKALIRRLVKDWIEMGTYPCTGGDNVLHYHFGHSTGHERWESWKDLQHYRWNHFVVFRVYEVRRCVRTVLTGKQHTGKHARKSGYANQGWKKP